MSEPLSYRYRAKVRRIIDADTLIADVDLGFRVTMAVTIRVRGMNAPEMHGDTKAQGEDSRAYLETLLHDREFEIQSYKDRQSFARWVCDIWLDGENLAGLMIAAGKATALNIS